MILKKDCKILLVVSEPAPVSIANMCRTCSSSRPSCSWIYVRVRISYLRLARARYEPYLEEHFGEAFWGSFFLHCSPQDIQDGGMLSKVSGPDCHGLFVPGLKEER